MLIEKIWSSREHAIQDLKLFMQENPYEFGEEKFANIYSDITKPRDGVIYDETLEFSFWKQKLPSRQACFFHFLEPLLEEKGVRSILEVGGGQTCRLSRMLAQKGYEVTCMEPLLDKSYEDEKLTLLKQAFDYRNIRLEPYDIVIGQEPCDATEHIVRACAEQNKPFVLILCGVPHDYIFGGTPKDAYAWYEYLRVLADGNAGLYYNGVYNGYKAAMLY